MQGMPVFHSQLPTSPNTATSYWASSVVIAFISALHLRSVQEVQARSLPASAFFKQKAIWRSVNVQEQLEDSSQSRL